MCSRQEWETFASRFQDSIDERQTREFVADALDRFWALVEEFKAGTCAQESAEWTGGRRRRSRPEWVA